MPVAQDALGKISRVFFDAPERISVLDIRDPASTESNRCQASVRAVPDPENAFCFNRFLSACLTGNLARACPVHHGCASLIRSGFIAGRIHFEPSRQSGESFWNTSFSSPRLLVNLVAGRSVGSAVEG